MKHSVATFEAKVRQHRLIRTAERHGFSVAFSTTAQESRSYTKDRMVTRYFTAVTLERAEFRGTLAATTLVAYFSGQENSKVRFFKLWDASPLRKSKEYKDITRADIWIRVVRQDT